MLSMLIPTVIDAVTKKSRISKTGIGAYAAMGGGIWAALPAAMSGDAAAIGAIVLVVYGWGQALYGRWKANQS